MYHSLVIIITLQNVCFSLFNGISTLMGYLMSKPSLSKDYLTHTLSIMEGHAFPEGIYPKMNIT